MSILSIQSHVAFGHVGNSAAVFPMQRLGFEVMPIHTVQFSNHPGYGDFRGQVFEANAIADLVSGLAERGALAGCEAVLSGYLGSIETGLAILDAVRQVKAGNPAAIYACDPVLGDVGKGIYVRDGIPALMRDRIVSVADILTPNLFELEFLVDHPVRSVAGMRSALVALHARGPRVVLVTSAMLDDTPGDAIDMVVSGQGGRYRLRTPRLAASVNGAGDAIAALFLVHMLKSGDPAFALKCAGASIHGVIRRTIESGARELRIVEAQDEFVSPRQVFEVEAL